MKLENAIKEIGLDKLPRRYCELSISKLYPCCVGWGSLDDNGLKTCTDEPMEENCKYIISSFEKIPAIKLKLH